MGRDGYTEFMTLPVEETPPEQVEEMVFEFDRFAAATSHRPFKHVMTPGSVAERAQGRVDC